MDSGTKEGVLNPDKKLNSSSSSNTSSEEPKVTFKSSSSATASPKPHEEPLLRDDKIIVSSDTSSKPQDCNGGFTDTPSPVSNLTNESTSQSMSPTQCPTIQVMERPAGYDPNRIPASVFAVKSPAPIEWSVASNESLFSIKMVSGELDKTSDLFISRDLTMSGEMVCARPPPPPPVVTESGLKSVDMRKNLQAKGAEEKVHPLEVSTSIKSDSDVSGTSSKSFAFPILTDGGTSTSVKGEPEQQQKQPSTSKENPKTASKSWFSCFSCCPKACC